MGHLYPVNVSKHLLQKLKWNWLETREDEKGKVISITGKLKKPKPLIIEDEINYFKDKIEQMRFAIKLIKDEQNLIFEKDLEKKHRVLETLKELMKKNFGISCADGCYFEEYMIELAISEVLAIWKKIGIVENNKNEWYLKEEAYNNQFKPKTSNKLKKNKNQLKDYIIEHIDL